MINKVPHGRARSVLPHSLDEDIVDVISGIWKHTYSPSVRGFYSYNKRASIACAARLADTDKLYFEIGDSQSLVIRVCVLTKILSEIHNSHQCAGYTYALAKGRYYWPSCIKTIRM